MAERADGAIDDILLPYVWQEAEGGTPLIVAIVSHGLFIAELVACLVKRDGAYQDGACDARNLRGLKNTACTKVQVTFKVCCYFFYSSMMINSNRRRII